METSKDPHPSILRPGLHLYAYVTNFADGTVSVVDIVRLASVGSIPVGPSPSGLRAHPQRKEIWGVSSEGGYVWVIDAAAGRVKSRIPVGAAPFAIDFSPDGKRAYVAASGAGTVTSIDCATQKVIATARTGRRPWLARVTPDGKRVLVPNRDDGTLNILDGATLATLAVVSVAPQPEQVVVLPDSTKAFLSANGSGQISVVDLRKMALLANLPLGGEAGDLILKPDGGELYVPTPSTHGLSIINTWTNEVAEFLLLGDAPTRGTLTAQSDYLYVSDAAAGRVVPVKINFRQLLPPIAVGERPGVLRFTPGDPGDDLLLAVNEQSNDLTIIRTRSNSMLTIVPVGRRPRDIAITIF